MKIKIPNKRTFFLGALLFALLFSCIAQCINLFYTNQMLHRIEQRESESRSVYAADAPMLASDAIYRLYECGGKIGIYDAKTEVLIDIIDVLVTTLPSADRLALKRESRSIPFRTLRRL